MQMGTGPAQSHIFFPPRPPRKLSGQRPRLLPAPDRKVDDLSQNELAAKMRKNRNQRTEEPNPEAVCAVPGSARNSLSRI
jgi:hypothetical protein